MGAAYVCVCQSHTGARQQMHWMSALWTKAPQCNKNQSSLPPVGGSELRTDLRKSKRTVRRIVERVALARVEALVAGGGRQKHGGHRRSSQRGSQEGRRLQEGGDEDRRRRMGDVRKCNARMRGRKGQASAETNMHTRTRSSCIGPDQKRGRHRSKHHPALRSERLSNKMIRASPMRTVLSFLERIRTAVMSKGA